MCIIRHDYNIIIDLSNGKVNKFLQIFDDFVKKKAFLGTFFATFCGRLANILYFGTIFSEQFLAYFRNMANDE